MKDLHLKNLPLQEGDVLEGNIEKVKVLTSPDAVKKTLHVALQLKVCSFHFQIVLDPAPNGQIREAQFLI